VKKFYRHQYGFTLIELMFILAFLAILFMYGLTITRNQARQEAIEHTAITIKSWLQATLAYYADHGYWPNNFDSDVVGVYLDSSLACSQFAASTPDGACPRNNASFKGKIGDPVNVNDSNTKYYSVYVSTPAPSIAKSIASKLPSSQVFGNKVSSSVPVPGAQRGYLTSAGVVTVRGNDQSDRTIWLPPCGPGFEAHYLVTPQYYTTGFFNDVGIDPDNYKDTSTGFGVLAGVSALNKKNGRYFVYANLQNGQNESGTRVGYGYYLTYCVPQGNWNPKSCPAGVDCQNYN